jgi:undecaprenyl-diphosphatase
MIIGIARAFSGRRDVGARTAANVVIASIPLVIAGFAFNYYLPAGIRSMEVIAWATIGFGIVLWLTDRLGMTLRRVEHLQASDAVIIGCAQVLALIPGTSRSGITMSAARMLGMERQDAARFSMLMSIPAILGAGVLKGTQLVAMGDHALTVSAVLALVLAFVSALVSIALLMAWLRRSTFTPFVIYRILLGVALLGFVHGWWAG